MVLPNGRVLVDQKVLKLSKEQILNKTINLETDNQLLNQSLQQSTIVNNGLYMPGSTIYNTTG